MELGISAIKDVETEMSVKEGHLSKRTDPRPKTDGRKNIAQNST